MIDGASGNFRPRPNEIFAIAILLSIAIVVKLSAGTEKLQVIGPRIAILPPGRKVRIHSAPSLRGAWE